MNRIFARNLTARAAVQIAGNPASTRLESGVANCFPGLEFDHRNLDRRFFPGLVFEFASVDTDADVPVRQGARLLTVDRNDPDLNALTFANNPADRPDPATQQALAAQLAGRDGDTLGKGNWFIESITQAGKTISLRDGSGAPFDGTTCWRIVRALERGPATIHLAHRPDGAPMNLAGWRRVYTDAVKGTISDAYKPGELSQSLCSPWMHDFRDCACFYWASNHPDIVLAEDLPGAPTLPDGASDDPTRANTPIDWLRADRSRDRTVPAEASEGQNRPLQMDHYQINKTWQDLDIVLVGKEISSLYQPRPVETAVPFSNPDELAAKLIELATLEHTVMLEYLYARYSVLNPSRTNKAALQQDLTFVRHEMLLIAVSEMRHLRWANQLLWELQHEGLLSTTPPPSLGLAAQVPGKNGPRPRALRSLTAAVLDDFIAVESPSGTLDGQYARVLTTLRGDKARYGENHAQLAARIVADGAQHYSRFREIRVVLQPYFQQNPPPYLVNLTPAPPTNTTAKTAVDEYRSILADLGAAYAKGDAEDFQKVANARNTMFNLDAAADTLAKSGLGIPFF